MAKKAFILSESDRDTLKEIIAEFRGMPASTTGRAGPSRRNIQAPDVYIARIPDTGLSGYSVVGTGIFPGSADCQIFRIVDGRLVDAGFERHVLNLSIEDIEASEYTLVERDKFGSWWVIREYERVGTDININLPGACQFASLLNTDCVCAWSPSRSLGAIDFPWWILTYDSGSGRWTAADATLGDIEFYWDGAIGEIAVTVSGMRLMSCENGCWVGGPFTGHGAQYQGTGTGTFPFISCEGEQVTFNICFQCCPCPDTGTDPVPAPCSGSPIGSDNVLCVLSNHSGDCANTTGCPGPPTNLGFGTDIPGPPTGITWNVACEASFAITLDCIGGFYVATAGGVTGTIVSFSASPFVLVVDFVTTTAQFCNQTGQTGIGGFRATFTV